MNSRQIKIEDWWDNTIEVLSDTESIWCGKKNVSELKNGKMKKRQGKHKQKFENKQILSGSSDGNNTVTGEDANWKYCVDITCR